MARPRKGKLDPLVANLVEALARAAARRDHAAERASRGRPMQERAKFTGEVRILDLSVRTADGRESHFGEQDAPSIGINVFRRPKPIFALDILKLSLKQQGKTALGLAPDVILARAARDGAAIFEHIAEINLDQTDGGNDTGDDDPTFGSYVVWMRLRVMITVIRQSDA